MEATQALAEKVIRNPYDLESFEKVQKLMANSDYWLRFYGLEFLEQIGIRRPELQPKVIPILVRALNEETETAPGYSQIGVMRLVEKRASFRYIILDMMK